MRGQQLKDVSQLDGWSRDGSKIEYTKVGKHRRIKFEDIIEYKKQMKEEQKKHLIDLMNSDEKLGLYDT